MTSPKTNNPLALLKDARVVRTSTALTFVCKLLFRPGAFPRYPQSLCPYSCNTHEIPCTRYIFFSEPFPSEKNGQKSNRKKFLQAVL